MNNAELIAATLDKFLDHPVSLVIYGRGGLALGFPSVPPAVELTLDLDVILSFSSWDRLQSDDNFWEARDQANEELSSCGLYISHLFGEEQLFLRPDWEKHIVAMSRPSLRHLRLYRPGTIDYILTKMMRGDDTQDMADIAFLIAEDDVPKGALEEAFRHVRLPDVPELCGAFELAKPHVLRLAI